MGEGGKIGVYIDSTLHVLLTFPFQITNKTNTFPPLVGVTGIVGCGYLSGGEVCGGGRAWWIPRKFLIRMQSREGRGVANPFRVGAGGAP